MAFTFELTMTGLNVLSIRKDAQGNEIFELLMVDGTTPANMCMEHQPYFSYKPEDVSMANPPADQLWPDAQGRQLAVHPLNGKMVSFSIVDPISARLTYDLCTVDTARIPNNNQEERCRKWTPSIDRLGLTTQDLKSGVLDGGIIPGAVVARAKLAPYGRLKSKDIALLNNSKYAIWDFKYSPTGYDQNKSQVIAGSIVWSFEVSTSVGILLDGTRFLSLSSPDGGVVSSSITNLPSKVMPINHPGADSLTHFHCFYRLAKAIPNEGPRIPHPNGTLATGGSVICPNLRVEW